MNKRAEHVLSKLERTLCDLNFEKGADCKIEDGSLWIQHRPLRSWQRANRIPPDLSDIAWEFLSEYVQRRDTLEDEEHV
jgi:hypothetical protein